MIVPSVRQARLILIGTALLLTLGMGIRQSFGPFLDLRPRRRNSSGDCLSTVFLLNIRLCPNVCSWHKANVRELLINVRIRGARADFLGRGHRF